MKKQTETQPRSSNVFHAALYDALAAIKVPVAKAKAVVTAFDSASRQIIKNGFDGIEAVIRKDMAVKDQKTHAKIDATEQNIRKDMDAKEQKSEDKMDGMENRTHARMDAMEQNIRKDMDAMEQNIRKDMDAKEQRSDDKMAGMEQRIRKDMDAKAQRSEDKLDKMMRRFREDMITTINASMKDMKATLIMWMITVALTSIGVTAAIIGIALAFFNLMS